MNETEILAKTIYGEARGESVAGQEAVANVILNRVKMNLIQPMWWGKTIQEVCLKTKQFSCWNKNDPNFKILQGDLSQNPVYQICERIAKRALVGCLKDNTNGATHYHSFACHPLWAQHLVPCAQIGHHLFYKGV